MSCEDVSTSTPRVESSKAEKVCQEKHALSIDRVCFFVYLSRVAQEEIPMQGSVLGSLGPLDQRTARPTPLPILEVVKITDSRRPAHLVFFRGPTGCIVSVHVRGKGFVYIENLDLDPERWGWPVYAFRSTAEGLGLPPANLRRLILQHVPSGN